MNSMAFYPRYDYGVLSYYPAPTAWVISFVTTDSSQNMELEASPSAGGIRESVFEVLSKLGERGWVVFQVDGYIEKDYPVYHLRRVSQ
jgi:hypothetical protein